MTSIKKFYRQKLTERKANKLINQKIFFVKLKRVKSERRETTNKNISFKNKAINIAANCLTLDSSALC